MNFFFFLPPSGDNRKRLSNLNQCKKVSVRKADVDGDLAIIQLEKVGVVGREDAHPQLKEHGTAVRPPQECLH